MSLAKSKACNIVARVITGIDKRNAYLIESALDRPISKAAVIVIPVQEVPVIKAKA